MAVYLMTWVTVDRDSKFWAHDATYNSLEEMADAYAKVSDAKSSIVSNGEYLPMPKVFIIDGKYRELTEEEYDLIEPGIKPFGEFYPNEPELTV